MLAFDRAYRDRRCQCHVYEEAKHLVRRSLVGFVSVLLLASVLCFGNTSSTGSHCRDLENFDLLREDDLGNRATRLRGWDE